MVIRHGDILLKSTDIPKDSVVKIKGKKYIVAEGETTGHCHTLESPKEFEVLTSGDREFLKLVESGQMTHQEHKTLDVPAGTYGIIHEREYDPFIEEARRVVD
jgi:hypothetical protein